MSTTSAIVSAEDLENVPLVRMEDVQPSRERNCKVEVLESCVVDGIEYDDCVVNDDEDSNIGSMVSIQSEEVAEDDDSDSAEMIVPEPLDEVPIDIVQEQKPTEPKMNLPDSWPTLEILPGGVIKHADKNDNEVSNIYPNAEKANDTNGEMMYACAKCSQSFKYLFCLVKHVKWHEDEKKKEKGLDMTKLTTRKKYVCLHSGKKKIVQGAKKTSKKS